MDLKTIVHGIVSFACAFTILQSDNFLLESISIVIIAVNFISINRWRG